MMKSVTSAQMRELDRRTIEEFGTPGEVLMERAGRGLAESVLRRKCWLGQRCRGVTAVVGKGNNGGDAFAAARILHESGVRVRVLAACGTDELKGDAGIHFRKMADAGLRAGVCPDPAGWAGHELDCSAEIIIDGILGTGASGPARGAAAAAIEWINRAKRANSVVAIDVPSGLNADSGTAEGAVVSADWTVTMGLPKIGLLRPCAIDHVGNLEVVDIGIPRDFLQGIPGGPALLSGQEVSAMVPPRRASSHKGEHGTALVIAGSAVFPGAAVLCAMGAVRSGAGLVYVITADSAAASVAAAVPEAIVRAVATDPEGAMKADEVVSAIRAVPKYNSLSVGPGMTAGASSRAVVEWVAANAACGAVLDADALNVVAARGIEAAQRRTDIVITPHPGEAARLIGTSAREVQDDRLSALRQLKQRFSGVVVLKGAGTLIGSGSEETINMTGNAGMAKGGSGDVLTGLAAGILAQGASPPDSARLAVYVHGLAGDIAACRSSMQGMTAGDTASCIGEAFASMG
jgi:NAD(P)H-hydrate epimerase